jgi:hypothetical protein
MYIADIFWHVWCTVWQNLLLGDSFFYLFLAGTQEEAAAAYDVAAIQYRGSAAVTNFELSHYTE